MKKTILALLVLISSVFATSYSRDYIIYEDDPEYVTYDEPEYIIYDEPEYIIERPVYYVRKPVVKETVIVKEPRRVVHYSNPATSFFSGLVGFGLGTAFGAAISD